MSDFIGKADGARGAAVGCNRVRAYEGVEDVSGADLDERVIAYAENGVMTLRTTSMKFSTARESAGRDVRASPS